MSTLNKKKVGLPIGAMIGIGLLAPMTVSADALGDSVFGQELQTAQSLYDYYYSTYASINNKKPTAEAVVVGNLTSQLSDATNQLESTPRALSRTYTNRITVSSLWQMQYLRYINATTVSERNSAKAILADIADSEASKNTFNGKGLDTTRKYKADELPDSVLQGLNIYFAELINSFHSQFQNHRTVYANTTNIAFAKAVAHGYESTNFVATSGHNLDAINKAAANYGLRTNTMVNQYENLTQAFVTSDKAKLFSEKELYDMVFQATLNFTIHDVYSNFAHTKSLLTAPTVGFDFSKVKEGSWDYYQMHVEHVPSPIQMVDANKFEPTYGIMSDNTIKPNASQATLQNNYNTKSASLSKAQEVLSSASASLSYEAMIASQAVTSAAGKLSSAQSAYNSYSTALAKASSAASQSSAPPASSSSSPKDDELAVPITAKLVIKAFIFIDN